MTITFAIIVYFTAYCYLITITAYYYYSPVLNMPQLGISDSHRESPQLSIFSPLHTNSQHITWCI